MICLVLELEVTLIHGISHCFFPFWNMEISFQKSNAWLLQRIQQDTNGRSQSKLQDKYPKNKSGNSQRDNVDASLMVDFHIINF